MGLFARRNRMIAERYLANPGAAEGGVTPAQTQQESEFNSLTQPPVQFSPVSTTGSIPLSQPPRLSDDTDDELSQSQQYDLYGPQQKWPSLFKPKASIGDSSIKKFRDFNG